MHTQYKAHTFAFAFAFTTYDDNDADDGADDNNDDDDDADDQGEGTVLLYGENFSSSKQFHLHTNELIYF